MAEQQAGMALRHSGLFRNQERYWRNVLPNDALILSSGMVNVTVPSQGIVKGAHWEKYKVKTHKRLGAPHKQGCLVELSEEDLAKLPEGTRIVAEDDDTKVWLQEQARRGNLPAIQNAIGQTPRQAPVIPQVSQEEIDAKAESRANEMFQNLLAQAGLETSDDVAAFQEFVRQRKADASEDDEDSDDDGTLEEEEEETPPPKRARRKKKAAKKKAKAKGTGKRRRVKPEELDDEDDDLSLDE